MSSCSILRENRRACSQAALLFGLSIHTPTSSLLLLARGRCVGCLIFFATGPCGRMNICWLCLIYTTSWSLFTVLCDIALPYHLLSFASWDMRICVSSFAMAGALQDGSTALKNAARGGDADAVQALLDAGADRYAEVRMTTCSLMTAHEIILSMG